MLRAHVREEGPPVVLGGVGPFADEPDGTPDTDGHRRQPQDPVDPDPALLPELAHHIHGHLAQRPRTRRERGVRHELAAHPSGMGQCAAGGLRGEHDAVLPRAHLDPAAGRVAPAPAAKDAVTRPCAQGQGPAGHRQPQPDGMDAITDGHQGHRGLETELASRSLGGDPAELLDIELGIAHEHPGVGVRHGRAAGEGLQDQQPEAQYHAATVLGHHGRGDLDADPVDAVRQGVGARPDMEASLEGARDREASEQATRQRGSVHTRVTCWLRRIGRRLRPMAGPTPARSISGSDRNASNPFRRERTSLRTPGTHGWVPDGARRQVTAAPVPMRAGR